MSLVRPTEISAPSHKNTNLYPLRGSSNKSGLSGQMYASNKHILYLNDSYCGRNYDPKYLSDSPAEESLQPSCSEASGNSFYQQSPSFYQSRPDLSPCSASQNPYHNSDPYHSNSESDCLESQSPDLIDYGEDKMMRLKLQELERELLDDNDDGTYGTSQGMDIDGEWAGSMEKALLHDSPKESSSSDSILSSISSSKEVSQTSSQTPKELLFSCAAALSEGHLEEALAIMNEVRQTVSIQGDPPQRIAAYMVEGLIARVAASGKVLYKALKCKEPPSSDRLAAMQILFEVCPCFKFGYMAANGTILEVFKGEKRVHIIDFDIGQGSQYIDLIQKLAKLPGKRPHFRLTGVDDPESVQRPVGGLGNILQRLEKLAEMLGVAFEHRAVPSKTSIVTPSMLDCRPGEGLIVNFAFQLHHMPDESVSTVNQRDQLLQMVKSLNPKLVTLVEQDVNTNTTPFFPRFVESYNYYSAVFDSLDATLPRESQDRINVEKQCLAKDIVNIIACEGEERIERYEVAGKWRARMMMAGFTPCPMSTEVMETSRKLIKEYCDRYKVKEEMGALHFGWEDKNLVVASAWR